ncbi:MAG: phosphoglycerate kinase [bacterium]
MTINYKDLKYIDSIDIKKKRLFIRVDFNVPLTQDGAISDDTRIRSVLPTINYALDEGASVILSSHMGRPKGVRNPRFSLQNVAKRLSRLLDKEVIFVNDCVGPAVDDYKKHLGKEEVMLLENLRFNPGEEKNDDEFAKLLAQDIDVYINDAFAVAHRNHASVSAITKFVPKCAAGFLMKKELNYFTKATENPLRPFVAIIGGAKVSSKLGAMSNLLDKVDKLIIGGGMAFTFLKALGYEVGKSIVENDMLRTALDTLQKAKEKGVKVFLPVDCVVANKFEPKAESKIVPIQEIPSDWIGMDIGPATNLLFSLAIQGAKTIIWNGPMGVFEFEGFSRGTLSMVSHVANSYALTIVGGGDTDVAIHEAGESANISYISTGGGAFLELLEGKELPALRALQECIKSRD